ncbi:hypothetical protein RF11_01404 [Thelohanellus kitauei]|uniref:Integrase zinc-binding domain-containing protein n=1 Tax=Thelohanellus kitauei TaxID=669202 RepID=A0A0C2J1V6_THEKT|nr:hypothetical protein RF11_01404 [Thelohanellus kitauei]
MENITDPNINIDPTSRLLLERIKKNGILSRLNQDIRPGFMLNIVQYIPTFMAENYTDPNINIDHTTRLLLDQIQNNSLLSCLGQSHGDNMAIAVDVKIEHLQRPRPTKEHSNADALSPIATGLDKDIDNKHFKLIYSIDLIDVPLIYIGFEMKLMNRSNITVDDNILLMNNGYRRVLISKNVRADFLNNIHKANQGIGRAKKLACRYCLWAVIDRDIENMFRFCDARARNSDSQP